MVIELKQEDIAVIPLKEEVTASLMWITQIVVRCPGPDHEGSVVMEYVPMTADKKIVARGPNGEDLTKSIRVDELYADMQACPELAAAFTAILACVKPVEAYLLAKDQEN
jgi:hypothetical protein